MVRHFLNCHSSLHSWQIQIQTIYLICYKTHIISLQYIVDQLIIPREGGPLIPPGPPLEPREPLGGPRLRECMGGGPLLPPLSNWGFVACSTLMGLPSRDYLGGIKIHLNIWQIHREIIVDLRVYLYLSIHFTCCIFCISWTLKCYKSKASWFVCFTVLH